MKKGLELRRLGDEGILLDPESGVFFRLTAAGVYTWESLCGSGKIVDSAVVRALAEQHLVEIAESDYLPDGNFEAVTACGGAFVHCGCASITDPKLCVTPCKWNNGKKQCR